MIFKKKKKEEELDIDEEDILDFEEFEENVKKKKLDEKAIEKAFIFHIENGCPICGQDVKGNDYYRYYCKNCNLLFSRNEIVEREFGKSVRDVAGRIKKTRLTEKEQAELQKKREALTKRIYETFSEKQKRKLIEKIERPAEETIIHKRDVEKENQKPAGAHGEFGGEIREVEYAEESSEAETIKEEYELECVDKIIASSQSTKIHAGNCHFVKKIHPENRLYLDSVEEGEEKGYALCVCLRRIRAKKNQNNAEVFV